jgi:hypothetical protein
MENLSERDRIQLSTHRRTPFVTPLGGRAAAENEPLDVIQITLGHQSMQTMLIYVQAGPRWAVQSLDRYNNRATSDADDDVDSALPTGVQWPSLLSEIRARSADLRFYQNSVYRFLAD